MSEGKKTVRRDLYQDVTDKLIAAIETGTAPWQRPWEHVASAGLPINGSSDRHYNGVNALLLMMTAHSEGYVDNRWFTFKQASDMGAKVRKGSKSTPVYFFKMLDAKGAEVADAVEQDCKRPRQIPFLTEYRVFNASQIDGVALTLPKRQWTPLEAVQQLVERMQPDIRYGGDRAFYAQGRDFIQMPPEGAFPSAEAFAGTLAHELGHWTGAEHRLNRKFGAWGTDAYAAEELRAEICSACLCAELGISTPMDNHAAYVGSWLKKLREDKFEIFRAAKDARKMVDLLTGRMALDAKTEDAVRPAMPTTTSAPQTSPVPVDSHVVSGLLARARKSIQRGQHVARNAPVRAPQVLSAQGANDPGDGMCSVAMT